MAYAFNENKSKVEVISKNEQYSGEWDRTEFITGLFPWVPSPSATYAYEVVDFEYVCPTDGYLQVYVGSNSFMGAYYVNVMGQMQINLSKNNPWNTKEEFLYCKKGTKILFSAWVTTNTEQNSCKAYFYKQKLFS